MDKRLQIKRGNLEDIYLGLGWEETEEIKVSTSLCRSWSVLPTPSVQKAGEAPELLILVLGLFKVTSLSCFLAV